MYFQSVLLLVVVLVGTALGQREFACPNPTPAECAGNPCDSATCPRFTSVNCCPEVLEGECTARFYRGNARRQPLKPTLCFKNIEYCTPTRCNANRVCVEEVVPCTRENCDTQAITAKCELIAAPLPVTDCDQVRRERSRGDMHKRSNCKLWGFPKACFHTCYMETYGLSLGYKQAN